MSLKIYHFIVLILLFLTESLGILLPGPCPDNLKPSESDFGEFAGIQKFSIPFSMAPKSFVSLNTDVNIREQCHGVYFNRSIMSLEIHRTPMKVHGSLIFEGDSLWLHTKIIRTDNVTIRYCNTPKFERVHIWTERYIKIIWSCRETRFRLFHDAAVFVVFRRSGVSWQGRLVYIQRAMNQYLPSNFLEHIEYTKKYVNSLSEVQVIHYCDNSIENSVPDECLEPTNNSELMLAFSLAIIFIVFLWLVLLWI